MGQDERDLGNNEKQFKLIAFRTIFGSTLAVCEISQYYMCFADYLEVVLEESSWLVDSLELLEPLFMTC